MRILQVHKYLYPRDGASTYLFTLADLLTKHGHEVGMWGTSENAKCKMQNVKCFEDLLVKPLNFDKREGIVKDFKKFGHMIWSTEAAGKFEKVFEEFEPDIIHIHNIYHHISPSILAVAKEWGVPVAATVHDYHFINPNYSLYDHGAVCERQGLRVIAHRCIKNSYFASAADVFENALHRVLGVYKNISRFIVPTEFMKKKMVEHGMDAGKIEVVPLPVAEKSTPTPPNLPSGRGGKIISPPLGGGVRGGEGYILYAGRLTQEKGVYLLLEIAKQLPEIKFKIAGSGPEEKNLALHVTRYKLHNVGLLGFVEKDELQTLIANARLVIVPSLWYEPSPYSVLEAMAAGKTVLATHIGGIADLIKDGKTGFLATPPTPPLKVRGGRGGVMDLIDKLRKVYYDEALLRRVGKAAQEYVKRAHDPEKHYEKIMEIYRTISH